VIRLGQRDMLAQRCAHLDLCRHFRTAAQILLDWPTTSPESLLRPITFRHVMPIEETMQFDAVYPAALQYDVEEKRSILETPGSVAAWMFVGDELVGESYGIPLAPDPDAEDDDALPWIGKLPPEERRTGIYCYSNTILPPYQRSGYGKILKA